MSDAKFTKGEWVVYRESDWYGNQDYDEIVIGAGTYNENPYDHYCCHKIVIECDDSDAEAIANANLIAKSPKMYTKLKELSEYFGGIDSTFGVEMQNEIDELLREARGEL